MIKGSLNQNDRISENNKDTRRDEDDSLYRRMVEESRDGICITQNGMFKYVNKAFCELVGYSAKDLVTMRGADLLAHWDKERMMAQHFNRMAGEGGKDIDTTTLIRKDGSYIDIEISATSIEYEGSMASFISARDITERNHMQQALEKSEQKYRSLIENARDGIAITQDGKFKFVNRALCEFLEYTEDELMEMEFLKVVAEEDKDRLMQIHIRRMSGSRHDMIYEAKAIAKSGKMIHLELNTTYIDFNDRPASFIILRDQTEKKLLEETLRINEKKNQEALARNEEQFRRVIQSLQEGLFVIQDEKFVFVNEAIVSILGYTVEEMLGKLFFIIVPDDMKEKINARFIQRNQGVKGSWSYEVELMHKDGVTRVPVILSTNVTEVDGKMAIVGTAKDITERVRAEKELKTAHHRLEEINRHLEQIIEERTHELTEVNTQLIKLQKENLQSQFDVLKQQVNPHFLFNSLNVLTSLIRIEPELAEKFTEHLAKVYRYVLENKDNELVPLSTELDFLDAYIFLLNIRFMGKLSVRINIEEDRKDCLVIPLAVQLLIENAIKHNTMSKKSPLVIDIFIDEKNTLNIINNLQERETNMASTGVGLKNIQNRYLLLNNTAPEFEKTKTQFIARIPLVCQENIC
jgi:PAS domain S-box-containing protein